MPNFEVHKVLDSSSVGAVFLALKDKSTKVVLKRIQKTPNTARLIVNEIRAGQALSNHPNVAKLLSYHQETPYCYLVFEYIEGVDLFTWLEENDNYPMPESLARSVFVQLVQALRYCHSKGIAHMDLKLENVLFDEKSGKATLIDFGLSEKLSANCKKWCGTWDYTCPSILRRESFSNAAADVWSLGTLLFVLLYGMLPFTRKQREEVMKGKCEHPNVSFPDEQFENWDVRVSSTAKDLLRKMLIVEDGKRITLEEVESHPWTTGNRTSLRATNDLKLTKQLTKSQPVVLCQ